MTAYYEVLPSAIKVRSAPSLDADVLDHQRARTVLECDAEYAGWVRLKTTLPAGQRGWMLVDGKAIGLGMLLKRVPASARLRELERDEEDAHARTQGLRRAPTDAEVEDWLDDIN